MGRDFGPVWISLGAGEMFEDRLYALATVLILAGVAMLCQPFSFLLHAYAFPVLLAGVVLFMVLDHFPKVGGGRKGKTQTRGRSK
jgi:hypothetical protein